MKADNPGLGLRREALQVSAAAERSRVDGRKTGSTARKTIYLEKVLESPGNHSRESDVSLR